MLPQTAGEGNGHAAGILTFRPVRGRLIHRAKRGEPEKHEARREDVISKTPRTVFETGVCERCGRIQRVKTMRSVTGVGKIVASSSRCVDEKECDEFVAARRHGPTRTRQSEGDGA